MESYTVLVVARTQALATRLADTLDGDQYRLRWVRSAAQAQELDLDPHLVLLELPASGGARSAARLKRRFDVPLVALADSGQPVPEAVDSALVGQNPLCDLVKLVEITLLAHSPFLVRAGSMSLDTEARRLQMNGSWYQLRPLSCRILGYLMARVGQVVPRQDLARHVWGIEDGDSTRALDVHVAQLRRQIEPDPRHPQIIVTERGVGYKLVLPMP